MHATDSHLRRLEDEPLGVPDRVSEHVASCPRCQERLGGMREDAHRVGARLAALQPVPDLDAAWARLVRELESSPAPASRRAAATSRPPLLSRPRRLPLRTALAAGALGVVIGGSAVAATLTSVFAPTHVAAVPLTQSDVGALASFMGLDQNQRNNQGLAGGLFGGFPATSGSLTSSIGTITWASAGGSGPRVAATLADAQADVGFAVALPPTLPAGVNGPPKLIVQPRVRVQVKLDSGPAGIDGSSITLTTGPAVLVLYGLDSGLNVPTLVVLETPRPTAVSSGASVSQIEAFVLARPDIPADVAQEIRLLGNVGTTLPIPVPANAVKRSVRVAGSPGVLVADPSNIASGVIWEDRSGMIRAVAGLIDQQDALSVAAKLG
jgi:hypothetical protein